MRIGIYPAAFDPIHKGHIAFARAAQAAYNLDKVFFLPEPSPTHKQGVKAHEHRANMVHLATANEPKFGVIMLNTQDFDIRLIWPRLTSRFLGSELFMLVGNSPIKRLGNWPHTSEFGKQAPTFIVAHRNKTVTEMKLSLDTLLQTKKLSLPFKVLEADYPIYSANEIRSAIRAGNQPPEVTHEVMEYVIRNKLYISGAI